MDIIKIQHTATSASYINIDHISSAVVYTDDNEKLVIEFVFTNGRSKQLFGANAERLIDALNARAPRLAGEKEVA